MKFLELVYQSSFKLSFLGKNRITSDSRGIFIVFIYLIAISSWVGVVNPVFINNFKMALLINLPALLHLLGLPALPKYPSSHLQVMSDLCGCITQCEYG